VHLISVSLHFSFLRRVGGFFVTPWYVYWFPSLYCVCRSKRKSPASLSTLGICIVFLLSIVFVVRLELPFRYCLFDRKFVVLL